VPGEKRAGSIKPRPATTHKHISACGQSIVCQGSGRSPPLLSIMALLIATEAYAVSGRPAVTSSGRHPFTSAVGCDDVSEVR
jgi:hypothetical protein